MKINFAVGLNLFAAGNPSRRAVCCCTAATAETTLKTLLGAVLKDCTTSNNWLLAATKLLIDKLSDWENARNKANVETAERKIAWH